MVQLVDLSLRRGYFGVTDLATQSAHAGGVLATGEKWRDAWSGKIYEGGQTIKVDAELHQIPLFVREGSRVDLGDLKKEWTESVAIANTRPDLKALDAEVRKWFEQQYSGK